MSTFRVNTNLLSMGTLRNLGETNKMFSDSVTRLSTGLRINSGADDPAGLQISEGFRAQLGAIDQAIRNNSDALNFSKTAEGALNEVSRLLREARALAVANGNDATLSPTNRQANQNQLNSIITSIDRIASQTQYGTKKLLDGTSGVRAAVTNTQNISSFALGGTIGDGTTGPQTIVANGAVNVNVTTPAAKATLAGRSAAGTVAAFQAATVGAANAGTFSVNGITFNATASMTNQQLVEAINQKSTETGVTAAIVLNGANAEFRLTANTYGTVGNNIQVISSSTALMAATGTANLASGTNAIATVTVGALAAVTFNSTSGDDGLTLRDTQGNVLKLTATGGSTAGSFMGGQVVAGQAQFQVGPNSGQRVSLSLGSTSASTLGVNALDIMSNATATTAMANIETAIESVATLRGNIGNFMRNVLESNERSLSVAKENLTASESAIRDVDVASEMSNYTRYQILQQSGLSVLAQANQAPQAVLNLLRG